MLTLIENGSRILGAFPNMIETQIPGLEVCKRAGSVVFNKAKYTNLKETESTAIYIPDSLDETKLKEASGCQVYVTKKSFFEVLQKVYVLKSMRWPDYVSFTNNDGSAPYNCAFSFQQLPAYTMEDGRSITICGACKMPGCDYKNENCPTKKLKQNKEVAIYNAHKRQKVAKRVTTLEVAQQAKIKYSSGTKNRFAS